MGDGAGAADVSSVAMRSRSSLAFVVVLLASLTACKPSAKPSNDEVSPDGHHHDWSKLPPAGASVKVSLDGKAADVAIASLPADGAPASVSFAQLWKAAWPAEDLSQLRFDFVGSDGFRPASKPKCAQLLTGRELGAARITVATHDLVFDEASKLAGCYRVRAVVAIEAAR
jgi:hypothetical protein